MTKIEMRISPMLVPNAEEKPVLVETADGVEVFASELNDPTIRKMYGILEGDFDSKVAYLKSLTESFFSIESPDVRLTVVEN